MVTRIRLLTAILAHSVALHAGAQGYPVKPVRILASSAGTTSDILARAIGPELNKKWDKPVIVENRSGRPSARMPAMLVAKATPDGYTLLMGETGSLATAPSLFPELEYKPTLDFAPITLVARTPLVLIASASVPVSNLRQFIAYSKGHPSRLNYASAGNGNISHLGTALFLRLTGIDATHVPYKGAPAGILSVVAGEVHFASVAASSAMPQVKAAKVKALAVAGKKRFDERFRPLDSVPTAAEAGVNGFECEVWWGLLAPARTPTALVSRLELNIVSILEQPDVREKISAQGAVLQPTTSEEFKQFIQAETKKWARVITEANISFQ